MGLIEMLSIIAEKLFHLYWIHNKYTSKVINIMSTWAEEPKSQRAELYVNQGGDGWAKAIWRRAVAEKGEIA